MVLLTIRSYKEIRADLLCRIPESLASGWTASKWELELKSRDSCEVCDEIVATSGYLYLPSPNQYIGRWRTDESHSFVSDSWRPYWLYSLWIIQIRILEWVAFPFSRGSSQPRDWTQVSHIAGWFFTSWATREAQLNKLKNIWGKRSNLESLMDKTWKRLLCLQDNI